MRHITSRVAFLLCLAATLTSTPLAQSDPALKKANEARQAAIGAGNGKEWSKYTTDDFEVTTETGVVKTKQERLPDIDGHPSQTQGSNRDEKWRMYGTTAVQTFAFSSAAGKPTRVTAVWVKDHGSWKVAAVQLTTIAEP